MKRIIVYSIIIFIFSVGIGYYYSKLWEAQNISQVEVIPSQTENVLETTAALDEKISYDASFAIKKYYNECGHSKLNQVELPSEFINLTEKEIEEIYSNWRVEEFNSNKVVLAQNIDSFCDDHYVLKLGEKNIEIYQMKEYDDFQIMLETNISKEYLTKEDIQRLEEGIFVFGIGNLNSALEDFE